MTIVAEPFWVHKRGSLPEEYEDRAYPAELREYGQGNLRVAVADGATESVFAKRWAAELVQAVGNGDLSPRSLSEGVARLRASWREWLAEQTLPWYAEEKARQGAFAALLALEFSSGESTDATEGCWYAAAVGDSCLFHVRGEEVLARFPLEEPEEFDNRPYLLSSIGGGEKPLNDVYSTGSWKSGDAFYLMTDALACWFLKYIDAGGSPASVRGEFAIDNEPATFPAWVEHLRDRGLMKNDDCTLVRVQIA